MHGTRPSGLSMNLGWLVFEDEDEQGDDLQEL